MFKGNNMSIVKMAARGQPQRQFCAVCGNVPVNTSGQICRGCSTKAQKRMDCIKDHGVVIRIVEKQVVCVLKSDGAVVHQGSGCGGCRFA